MLGEVWPLLNFSTERVLGQHWDSLHPGEIPPGMLHSALDSQHRKDESRGGTKVSRGKENWERIRNVQPGEEKLWDDLVVAFQGSCKKDGERFLTSFPHPLKADFNQSLSPSNSGVGNLSQQSRTALISLNQKKKTPIQGIQRDLFPFCVSSSSA